MVGIKGCEKMKINSIFLWLVLIIVLTGCSIENDIVINHKMEVKETLTIKIEEVVYDENEYDDRVDFLKDKVETYKGFRELSNYNFYESHRSEESQIKLETQFRNLSEYTNSYLLNYAFLNPYIVDGNNEVSFYANGSRTNEMVFGEHIGHGLSIDEYYYRVKSYTKILDHNADDFDEQNNVLTWYYNSETENKNIYFKIGNDIRYDVMVKDFIMSNIHYIITIGTIIGILLIASIYFVIIYRKNNSI